MAHNDPTVLNSEHQVLWFDDLGTGNENHRFLSNFYRGEDFTIPGIDWPDTDDFGPYRGQSVSFPTGEHAFAAMKFWGTDWQHFANIVNSDPDNPNVCKSLGRSHAHPLRPDWEVVKLDVMAAVVRSKFTLDREEGPLLLGTGGALLTEGTFWQDSVWGVDLTDPLLPGRNWLGTLLMARRAELRAQEAARTAPKAVQNRVDSLVINTAVYNAEFATE